MYLMEKTQNNKKKVGDGYETLRVKAELKTRIINLQNQYFAEESKKISVNDLLREALDAREKLATAAPKSKRARVS